ncbi:hypothetical protein [Candidatus Nitrosacidococcus tergens]|uniref:Uncharacterized protein n=1 Tax=Candidatus Nitrosacidococcus tergens TaxID=553981 RepID=A0A7G1QA25_9GAMM|nr:hypothetical protein [Candidatus Nitrosacidococcus tergens]CAB1276224.1 protein of unknown function [Candidatus Nitrosacidococcus tergens]
MDVKSFIESILPQNILESTLIKYSHGSHKGCVDVGDFMEIITCNGEGIEILWLSHFCTEFEKENIAEPIISALKSKFPECKLMEVSETVEID